MVQDRSDGEGGITWVDLHKTHSAGRLHYEMRCISTIRCSILVNIDTPTVGDVANDDVGTHEPPLASPSNGMYMNDTNSTHTNNTNGAYTNGTNGATRPESSAAPIAICGMGVRLPGGIRSPSDLFTFLLNKGDARNIVPPDRYNVEAYYDPSGKPGTTNTKHGYYLDDINLADFDASMFGMSNAELSTLDPAQRLLLEVTREALESAGEGDFRGSNIGTFIGDFTEDWQDMQNIDLLNHQPYLMLGRSDFALANRVAFEYDLLGPSMTVKTACSATAEAVHHAVLAIRSGSCSGAIVGGANLIITPRTSISMSMLGLLAPDGNCKTFDASADGFARGESVCALYLKPLDEAIRDRNPVRAVIRACDSNADGGDGSRTFGTPNPRAQEALIRQTYASAGLPLGDTKVVELHGTGTVVGDPLETSAVAQCFGGDDRLYIGSVKPNLGHGEGASALTSIVKSIVALENKTVLPNIKFHNPNPKIPWHRNLHVPVEPTPWPDRTRERISMNSFGLGGSNVHMVLDSAESMGVTSQPHQMINGHGIPKRKTLLLISGNSEPAITELATNYADYLQKDPSRLHAMAYTLASRRERLKLGSYCIADGASINKPATPSERKGVRAVAFVFTGQGAQWVGMGREMVEENTVFLASINEMDQVLRSVEHPPDWSLRELLQLTPSTANNAFNPPDISQPLCAALQIAYVDALAAWDIKPSAVVGHSSGEVAAAYAAGVLTRREAIIAAYYRGYACARCETPGTMAAVGLGSDEVQQYLKPGAVLACENSNASVTISGDVDAVQETMASLQQAKPNVFVRQLRVPIAYHSHHIKAIGELYRSLVSPSLSPKTPTVPFYSTVWGRRVRESKALNAQYWQLNIEQPVLFRTAVSKMLADLSNTAYLEIGPHSAMAGPLRHIFKETDNASAPYTSVAERGQDAADTFLSAIGGLFCLGITPRAPISENAYTLPDLPTYPWNYTSSYWSETRMTAAWRFRKHRPHELLGQRILESSDLEPAWRNFLRLSDVPWLVGHCVEKDVVFPAAGYIAMAGTAVSQLPGSRSGYTVQNVNIAAATLLEEGRTIELVTTLRKHALTSSNDSRWWEFSICSESRGTWTKHCWGLVTDGCAVACPGERDVDVAPFRRPVDAKRWYHALSRTGLNYSDRFIGLQDMTASPVDMKASLSITDRQTDGEEYALHPSTLDIVLQSWSVAATKGEYRQLNKMFLPTFIEQFYVGSSGRRDTLRVRTTAQESAVVALGDSYGVTGTNEIAFVLAGFQGTRMNGSIRQDAPATNAWSIQWHPAIEFAHPGTLVRPTQDMTDAFTLAEQVRILCAVEIAHEAATVSSLAQPFFKHFVAGVTRQLDYIDQGQSKVRDAVELKALDREARVNKLAEWRKKSKGSPVEATVEALWRTCERVKDVLEGRQDFLDLLLTDDALQKLYNEYNAWSDNRVFFQVLGLNKPQLRILEIGAGTGSLTAVVLEALHSAAGERLYGEYTITDVSAGFINQTKERFSEYQNLKFSVCDIALDPLEQGFEAGSYDLILASNVLHATPNVTQTLKNCRTLLKPDGQIYMQEVCSEVRFPDLIFGLFEGWWVGREDNRVDRPVISEDEWDTRLRHSGFQGIQFAVRDNNDPDLFTISNIVARAGFDQPEERTKPRVTLLKPSTELGQFGQAVKSVLEDAGYSIDEFVWGSKIPDQQDIISLMDVDDTRPALLADINSTDLARFVEMVEDVSGQAVLWLMRSAQTECFDPHQGKMLGMARCIRAEIAIDFVTVELDRLDKETGHTVANILKTVRQAQQTAADTEDSLDIESEYTVRQSQVLVSRMHKLSVDKALAATSAPFQAKQLTLGQPGMLQTMSWTGHRLPPLAPGDVQVRILYAGLNFHDVAEAIGIMDPDGHSDSDGYHGLGAEGTAIVTAVGDDVKHVSIGDRVVFMEIPTGAFATELQMPADLVIRAPGNVSNEDAAGLTVPYLTVLWGFMEKAHLKRGQKVLIHSAAGGVGIAAIHVARWLQADIYCTVGSPEKVDFLIKELGVSRHRIFHSRDDSCVADVMRATNGVGVDVVLNSLSGELLHASWKCVAREGCMLDLGKRDFLGRGRLALRPFADNRSFFGIDLAALSVHSKHKVAPLLQLMVQLLRDEKIFPLHPTTVFEAERIQDAFRYMQKGIHRGRIVIKMSGSHQALPTSPPTPRPTFKPDAVYLLTGGLGGLGRSVLSWMVSHGARHLAVISPTAGTRHEHVQFIAELRERGCELRCFAGDVSKVGCVRGVVHALQTAGPQIRGVLHLAMVLRDTGFVNLDHASWTTVADPKVQGTLNLHHVLPRDMDFFLMFGSTSGTLGSYGQSNYAAANSFLDSFTHFRHGLGLPAAVLDIAAVGDVGYVASTKDVAERLERTLTRFMSEADFLHGLHLALERSAEKYASPPTPTPTTAYQDSSQIILYNELTRPLSDPQNTMAWRRDPRLSIFRNNQDFTVEGAAGGSESLRSFFASLPSEPEKLNDPATVTFLAQEIAKRIFSFLMKEDVAIDTSQTLTSMGADSLVAIETRNWWKHALGVDITVLELTNGGHTMELLGGLAVERLREKFLHSAT